MKITDQLVQMFMEDEFDNTVLRRESFPVNIRLYKNNPNYRDIILNIVRYMDEHLRSHFEDYADPRGVAAANLGFPFKIIGFRKNRMNENQFCLNPKVTHQSDTTLSTTTNCGSLRLPEFVSVDRSTSIDLEYYDLEGTLIKRCNIYRAEGAFTIQNAIDQVNGITIIDRHEKDKEKAIKETKKAKEALGISESAFGPNSVGVNVGCC